MKFQYVDICLYVLEFHKRGAYLLRISIIFFLFFAVLEIEAKKNCFIINNYVYFILLLITIIKCQKRCCWSSMGFHSAVHICHPSKVFCRLPSPQLFQLHQEGILGQFFVSEICIFSPETANMTKMWLTIKLSMIKTNKDCISKCYLYWRKKTLLTIHLQHMYLVEVFIAISMTAVVSHVDCCHLGDVQGAIVSKVLWCRERLGVSAL